MPLADAQVITFVALLDRQPGVGGSQLVSAAKRKFGKPHRRVSTARSIGTERINRLREECIGNQDPDPDDLKVSGLKGFVTDKQTVPSNLNRLQLARLLRETRGR